MLRTLRAALAEREAVTQAHMELRAQAEDKLAEAVGVIHRIVENHMARLTERGILVYGQPVADTGFVEALKFLAGIDEKEGERG